MKEYSEFVRFVIEKTGIKKPLLIEKDILLHALLHRLIKNREFGENYVFKGGSCLVKCYFGYYRFSVDLDFTYLRQERWENLTKSERRRELVSEAEYLSSLIKNASRDLGLEFIADLRNNRFVEFSSGSRLITYKLYHRGELLKIQVNLVETLLFKPQRREVNHLLRGINITDEERAYFKQFLEEYCEFEVLAYDLREILCEKVRAILTRRVQKLRDLYDLYMLERRGLRIEDYEKEIARKLRPALRYRRYREAFERNKKEFRIPPELVADNYESSLFVKRPNMEEFGGFLAQISKKLRKLINEINFFR